MNLLDKKTSKSHIWPVHWEPFFPPSNFLFPHSSCIAIVRNCTIIQLTKLIYPKYCKHLGPLHVLWQVSFGSWVTWSISSWKKYYKSVYFSKAEWWKTELLFLSLNNWGLNFLQNECSQSSQIYISPEKLRKMFTFQSCKFLNDKIDQNINFAKLLSVK